MQFLFVDGVDHGGTFLLHRSNHFLVKGVQAVSTHVVFVVDVARVCLDRAFCAITKLAGRWVAVDL